VGLGTTACRAGAVQDRRLGANCLKITLENGAHAYNLLSTCSFP
jgi:hypothetical protein